MTEAQNPVNAFYSLNSQARYDAVIAGAREGNTLWTLADDQGCVILDSGKEKCLLIWHSEELAQSWQQGDYAQCQPMAIKLADFIEKWAPGMTNDGFEVAVAPSLAGEGIVVSAEELAAELDQ